MLLTFFRIFAKFGRNGSKVSTVDVAGSVSVEKFEHDPERLQVFISWHLLLLDVHFLALGHLVVAHDGVFRGKIVVQTSLDVISTLVRLHLIVLAPTFPKIVRLFYLDVGVFAGGELFLGARLISNLHLLLFLVDGLVAPQRGRTVLGIYGNASF